MDLDEFTEAAELFDQSELDKVKLFAYHQLRADDLDVFTTDDVCAWFGKYNLPKPNTSRLKRNIRGSRIFVNGDQRDTYRLHATTIRTLDKDFRDKFELPESMILKTQKGVYVDHGRISELADVKSKDFDLRKLVALCEELNAAHKSGSSHSSVMLVRAIIDHVPPIFGCKNFKEVANNYSGGGGSFKSSMANLDKSSRKIADRYLHTHVRKKETLPTIKQVDFSNDLDVLLSEVVRVLS